MGGDTRLEAKIQFFRGVYRRLRMDYIASVGNPTKDLSNKSLIIKNK